MLLFYFWAFIFVISTLCIRSGVALLLLLQDNIDSDCDDCVCCDCLFVEVGGHVGACGIVKLLESRNVKLDYVLDEGIGNSHNTNNNYYY